MKKLLLSSIVLLLFSCSILIFQVSCQKEALADTKNTTQLNKIAYTKSDTAGVSEIWTSNNDGTNQQKVNISLPANYYIRQSVTVSNNGTLLIFPVETAILNSGVDAGYIYSCNLDGSNLKRIIGDGSKSEIYTVDSY